MDWPPETEPYLDSDEPDPESGIGFFEYDCGLSEQSDPCLVLGIHGVVSLPLTRFCQPMSCVTYLTWKLLHHPNCWTVQ